MGRIKAAAIQFAPDLGSCARTVEKLVSAAADAANAGAQIAVFPETCVPYYPYFSFVLPPATAGREHMRLYAESVEVPGPVTETLAVSAMAFDVIVASASLPCEIQSSPSPPNVPAARAFAVELASERATAAVTPSTAIATPPETETETASDSAVAVSFES